MDLILIYGGQSCLFCFLENAPYCCNLRRSIALKMSEFEGQLCQMNGSWIKIVASASGRIKLSERASWEGLLLTAYSSMKDIELAGSKATRD